MNVTFDLMAGPTLELPLAPPAEYSDNFVTKKVDGWISEIKTLSSADLPHAIVMA